MKNDTKKYLCWFIWIAIGMLIISFIYPIIVKYVFSDFITAGSFGDSYGALNAIFSGLAFAGVIITILIQRHELELQREELIETREEFTVNRITNITYNQLERFEEAIDLLILPISDSNKTEGIRAILYLDSKKEIIISGENKEIKKSKILKNVKLYTEYGLQIQIFAIAAYNAMNVVKASLVKCKLSIEIRNEIKEIFFRNIGFKQLNVIENISETIKDYHKHFNTNNPKDLKVIESIDIEKFGDLTKANIYLKKIDEFRRTILTEDKIEEFNNKWNEEFGIHS